MLPVRTGLVQMNLADLVDLPSSCKIIEDTFLVFGNEIMWQGELDNEAVSNTSPFLCVCPLAKSAMTKLSAELVNLFV